MTNLNTKGFSKAAEQLGIKDIGDSTKLPLFTADLRVGGIFLPFDVDIAIMKTPTMNAKAFGSDMSFDVFTIGFDARYAILEGGLIMPKLSVGLGYFYNSGKIKASSSDAEASIEYKIHTLYLSAQVSKEFSIPVVRLGLTPFVGGRLFVSKHENDWDWALKNETAIGEATLAGKKWKDSGTDASSGFDFNSFQPQLFAGVGVNFALLQLTASISIDPRTFFDDKLWTGAISLRVRH